MKKSIVYLFSFLLTFSLAYNFMSFDKNLKSTTKYDSLSLENGHEIILTLDDNKKVIFMDINTFKYIISKKSISKKTLENLNSLFARFD